MKTFRITDPIGAYPISEVVITSPTNMEAKRGAAEAMLGCDLDKVDESLVQELLANLQVRIVNYDR